MSDFIRVGDYEIYPWANGKMFRIMDTETGNAVQVDAEEFIEVMETMLVDKLPEIDSRRG